MMSYQVVIQTTIQQRNIINNNIPVGQCLFCYLIFIVLKYK